MNDRADQGPPATARGALADGSRTAVVLLMLAATLLGAWLTHRAAEAHQRARFDAEVERIDSAIEMRMTAYVQVLRGGLGLFRASDEVTRTDWRRYVDTLRLEQRYPGFKSLSFAQAVPARELDAFVRRVRAEPRPPGLSVLPSLHEYALRAPVGSRGTPPIHSPIVWVAPFSAENQRVLGVDMMREPQRRAAMLRAVRTQSAVLSPRLKLSGSADDEAGFIAYVAIAREGRTVGWLTAAFRTEEFMRGLLDRAGTTVAFELQDGAGGLLYSTAGTAASGGPRPLPATDAAFERRRSIPMPGRRWQVHYVAPTGFVPLSSRLAPWLVLVVGLLATLAFFVVGRVAERWRRLADQLARQTEDLHEARTLAEDAARSKAAFLATMSHEIRTPMNAVVGMSALLSESTLDEEQRAQADVIRSSGDHLLHVVDDILDLSKLEAGKVELDDGPLSVRACATSVVDLLAGDARRAGVTLQLTIDDTVPGWIAGDEGRVRQVLLNLLSNAVKFTPDGGRVTVTVGCDAAGGVAFAVRDTGPGIPPAALERLFTAYQQADASITRTHGGTGLGLTIAQRLAHAMGGRIDVQSRFGDGATFRFVVPAREVEPPTGHGDLVPRSDAVPADLGETHPLRVLVAEDSSVNQLVARTLLARLGYETDVVANGRDVLDAIARRTYDVVLMDLRMPVLDGLETARRIVADARPDGRPRLVAMTADVLAEHRAAALAAGMDDFVAKPVTLPSLAAALQRTPRRHDTALSRRDG